MTKAPMWFFAVAAIALLWNLAGLAAVGADLQLSAADIDALPPAQQALYHARPFWAVIGSVLAVGAGTLGCLLLLLRRYWAFAVLCASLVGIVLQDLGFVVVARVAGPLGTVPVALQGFVLLVGIGLVFLSRHSVQRIWLK